MCAVAILDSAYRGGHYSKITFIVRPLHITVNFLHLYTLKIDLKLHVCVLKIFGLAMPMHMSTFHQDFPQLILHQGGPWPPLKSPMSVCMCVCVCVCVCVHKAVVLTLTKEYCDQVCENHLVL